MILLLDNYDSFAHNLARYLRRLGQEVEVARNDAIDVATIRRLAPQAVVLSPGPCTPNEAGCSLEVVRELHTEFPMLGICLGHQAIAQALGGRIVRSATPMHGRVSLVEHDHADLFAGLPSPFTACRYHSLVVEPTSLPSELRVTATCVDGNIMSLRHVELPLFGLQFHPESILTEYGFPLLRNFLSIAGLAVPVEEELLFASELRQPGLPQAELPQQPVTF